MAQREIVGVRPTSLCFPFGFFCLQMLHLYLWRFSLGSMESECDFEIVYCSYRSNYKLGKKSLCFFYGNTPMDLRAIICSSMGVLEAITNNVYLGLLIVWERANKALLSLLEERVAKRIQS